MQLVEGVTNENGIEFPAYETSDSCKKTAKKLFKLAVREFRDKIQQIINSRVLPNTEM